MSQVTRPVTQPMADVYRTFDSALKNVAQSMTDEEIEEALTAFSTYASDNCEWTHYRVRGHATTALLQVKQDRRRHAIRAEIEVHKAAIRELEKTL